MSTCEAELQALADCAVELLYVIGILEELGYQFTEPVVVYTDNQAAYDLCYRLSSCGRTKHIERRMFKMRELRGAGKVVVKKIPTDQNRADLFTKPLLRQPFERLRRLACAPCP